MLGETLRSLGSVGPRQHPPALSAGPRSICLTCFVSKNSRKEAEGKGVLGILLKMVRPAGKPLREGWFKVNDQECAVDVPAHWLFRNAAEIAGFRRDCFLLS